MNKKTAYIFLYACGMALVSYGCHRQQEVNKMPENAITIKGSVRELNLYPENPPEFPEHEGKAEFVSYCAICHSLKYISMQPAFSAKTWDAEVTKMIVKYKAPIDSVTSKKIVGYLIAVKGK